MIDDEILDDATTPEAKEDVASSNGEDNLVSPEDEIEVAADMSTLSSGYSEREVSDLSLSEENLEENTDVNLGEAENADLILGEDKRDDNPDLSLSEEKTAEASEEPPSFDLSALDEAIGTLDTHTDDLFSTEPSLEDLLPIGQINASETVFFGDSSIAQVAKPERIESFSLSDDDLDALLFAPESSDDMGMAGGDFSISDLMGGGDTLEKGLQTLLKKTAIYYEHLPMLDVVFDHLTRLLSTSLRNFTSENVELSIDSIKSKRLGDYLNSVELPAMFSIFKAEEWDNQGLIIVDNTIIYSIVDALLGGRNNSEYENTELRLYTTIEHNLMAKFIEVVLQDCAHAFLSVSYVNFVYERIEYNPHFAMISRPTSPGIVLTIKFEINDDFGKFSLFFPYATLEPVRELLMQNFMGEKFGRDSIWESHLVNELKVTEVKMDVILLTEMQRLSDVFKWKAGDTVMFNAPAETKVKVLTGSCPLFLAMVGHKNGHIAVQIEESYMSENSFKLESLR